MHSPYKPYHTRPHIPDMPVSPPEPDDATWEKNNRNSIRQEAIDALGTVISRLDELNFDGSTRYTQRQLEKLWGILERNMED